MRQLRHGLCMCAILRMNGHDKTGYGIRCQELQRCWVFHAQQFPVCINNGPPPKWHPANFTQLWEALESTWASIPFEMLSTPCRVHASTNWGCSEGKRGCNSILVKCSHSVHDLYGSIYEASNMETYISLANFKHQLSEQLTDCWSCT